GALGVPSVVIMALNPISLPTGAASRSAVPATGAIATGIAGGRKLYSQICVSCHGPDGNMIADHKLSTLKSRRDLAATISYIKDPKAPMPKLFPDLITEQNVADVAAYVRDELAR